MKKNLTIQASDAKQASIELAFLPTNTKNNILKAIANALEQNIDEIILKNKIDIDSIRNTQVTTAFIDRLTLNKERILAMIKSIDEIIALEDPIGEKIESHISKNNLLIKKVRVPLGVITMIYEARPNVTIDSIALAIKSGNSIILKGGAESIESNSILTKISIEAGIKAGMPNGSIQFIETSNREDIYSLLQLNHLIDVVIPRGSQKMIDSIIANSKIPVIKHGKGLCHTYVDKYANIEMALNIVLNAKTQRPGVCNATETLLIHKEIATEFLPKVVAELKEKGVKLYGCENTLKIVDIEKATSQSWDTEYLDLELSIKIVSSLNEAINHIQKHGTAHSESIVTNDKDRAEIFLQQIDAAAVYHNASTRFTDGSIFGLGAEIGISTQKLHARGPMGIKDLTSYKFIIYGNGQIRE